MNGDKDDRVGSGMVSVTDVICFNDLQRIKYLSVSWHGKKANREQWRD